MSEFTGVPPWSWCKWPCVGESDDSLYSDSLFSGEEFSCDVEVELSDAGNRWRSIEPDRVRGGIRRVGEARPG